MAFFAASRRAGGVQRTAFGAFEQVKGVIVLERVLMAEATSSDESAAPALDDTGFEQLTAAFVAELLKRADQHPAAFLAHWNFDSIAYRLNRFSDPLWRHALLLVSTMPATVPAVIL